MTPLLPGILPTEAAREEVLRIIRGRTSSYPASIAYLQSRVGITERTIKQIVADARLSGEPISACRGRNPGYYLASTPEELERSAQVLTAQAKKMLMAASRLVARKRILEWLGQEVIG